MHTLIVAVEPVDRYLGQGLAVRWRDVEDVDDAESGTTSIASSSSSSLVRYLQVQLLKDRPGSSG